EKIRRDAREIVDVLRVDLPAFIKRYVKDRFLAAGAFADAIGDTQVKALKADVDETALKASAEIVPTLEDWPLWLAVPKPFPAAGERRDLSGHPDIQARIQKVGDHLRALLERHRFPEVRGEELNEAYRLPTWFIGGRLIVSLVESYWRNLEEFASVQSALTALNERDRRAKRSERWDGA
ncbi:MAG: hypothetical protein ACRELB_14285, partial [Polyangiaceae bacterium]